MYISPFTTSRTFTVRLLPPRLPGRMSGSTWLHSASVKSLGYRSLLRSYRERFSIVHIGYLSTTQAAPGRLSLHHKRLIQFNMFPNRLLGTTVWVAMMKTSFSIISFKPFMAWKLIVFGTFLTLFEITIAF